MFTCLKNNAGWGIGCLIGSANLSRTKLIFKLIFYFYTERTHDRVHVENKKSIKINVEKIEMELFLIFINSYTRTSA